MDIQSDIAVISVIALTAVGTYILRISGLLFSGKIPNTPRLNKFMDTLPGTILLAIVVPTLLEAGLNGLLSVILVVLSMMVTRNVLLAMCTGMITMIVLRMVT